MKEQTPDSVYPDDLLVVTSYFNPSGYERRASNYVLFAQHLRARRQPLMTVACTFPGQDPFLPIDGCSAIHLVSSSVLWQKERLLNIGIDRAPAHFTKIAWVDADVLFEDPAVFENTSRALEDHSVVQMFENVCRLPKDSYSYSDEMHLWKGFAARRVESPLSYQKGWLRHGHTGFAWAARREVLAGGLFDLCLSGGGDHLMAHAFVGDWYSSCIDNLVGLSTPLHLSYRDWARTTYRLTEGRLGFVSGRALHLWHGDENRSYQKWSDEMKQLGVDPYSHLNADRDRCLEWRGAPDSMVAWSTNLFDQRKEDG